MKTSLVLMKTTFSKPIGLPRRERGGSSTASRLGWFIAAMLACTPPAYAASMIQFSSATCTVSEAAGTVTLTVQRTDDVDTPVSVDYATLDGTAIKGVKYIAVSGTLFFAAGETNQPILVPILNNGVIDGSKYFKVTLSNPSEGASLGTCTNAIVTITDNDSALRLLSSTYRVNEEAGFVEIAVFRGDDGDYTITVDFVTTDSTALAGIHYAAMTNTLTFTSGERLKTVWVEILNDAVRDVSKTFRVALSNLSGGAQLGSPAQAMVTITDTDDQTIKFEFSNYYTGEEAGFVRIGVVRGDSDSSATVDLQTVDDIAQADLDYGGLTNTLSFAPGERLKLIDIPIFNDGFKEGDETFLVQLANATGGALLSAPASTMVKIRDNDPGVQFMENQLWVEEDKGSVLLTVTRGNDQLLDAFTVDYATTNSTATAGSDYIKTQGTLAFAAGEMRRSFAVPILDDGVAEVDEQFKVVLSNPTAGMILGTTSNLTATVTVCDRELLPHRFDGVRVFPDGSVTLTLGGGFTPGLSLSNRFVPYLDLYPIEVSSNLVDWAPLTLLVRTNSATNALVYTDASGVGNPQRFYRVATRTFITPNQPPTGLYRVGRIDRWLTDPTRRNRALISTNNSFQVAIWYPTPPRTGSWPLPCYDMPVLEDETFWVAWTDRTPSFVGYASAGLDLAPSQPSLPVVLISPGLRGTRHDLWEKAEELASHGYIVVPPDHFDAWAVVLPDGTYVSGGEGKDRTDPGLRDRVKDLSFIVDQMEEWNLVDPTFAGWFDLGRLAALGFSWGGGAAAEFCRVDSRVKAVVVLEGYFQNAETLLSMGLAKPVLLMYRGDSSASDSPYFDKLACDALWLQVSGTAHADFGGFGWWPAGTVASAERARDANRTINAYMVWFLDKYLKGSTNPMPSIEDNPRVFNLKQK